MKKNMSFEDKRALSKKVNKVVCEYFNVSTDSVYTRKRNQQIAMARSFIIYILHKDLGLSINFVAFEFKRTTRAIFWNCDIIGRYIKLYKEYQKKHQDLLLLMKDVLPL